MAEKGGLFTLGLVFIGVGLSVILHALFTGMLIRCWSRYALTNQRAFVLVTYPVFGADISHWPINAHTDLRHNNQDPMTITFNRAPRWFFGPKLRTIGFEQIENGLAVFRLMMQMREDNPT